MNRGYLKNTVEKVSQVGTLDKVLNEEGIKPEAPVFG